MNISIRATCTSAVASMMSDMQKHPETAFNSPILDMLGIQAARGDIAEARRYIDGFN